MSTASASSNCSVSRTLDIVADPWTFLVLREAWFGVRRFDVFRRQLGMPRGTLTARLKHLVAHAMLYRVRYRRYPERFEYRLTPKAADLYPSMLVLMHWGDRWLAERGPPLRLQHRSCGQYMHAVVVCGGCREPVNITDVAYRPGPGAGVTRVAPAKRMRRSSKPENFLKHRQCCVARVMQIVRDRWTYLILREAFFGARRFHEVQRTLGVSANILTNRLQRLLDYGIFARRRYALAPERFEYRFTARGQQLHASFISLMRWGDRWLVGDTGAPLLLTHVACGLDFEPLTVCSECRQPIEMRDMKYEPGPGATRLDNIKVNVIADAPLIAANQR